MNSPLEQYLRQLQQRLRFVPARWKGEQIAEVRQHLEARVEELVASGVAPREAEEEALRHFGGVGQTARSLMVAWWRQFLPLDVVTRRAASVVVAGWLLTIVIYPLLFSLYEFASLGKLGINLLHISYAVHLLHFFLVGTVAGRMGGRRGIAATLWGFVGGWTIARITGEILFAIQMSDPQARQQFEQALAQIARGEGVVMRTGPEMVYCAAMLFAGAYFATRHQLRRAVV